MEVKHYQDEEGNWFREIINNKYSPLRELREAYQKKGYKTWLNSYQYTKWILTVCTGKER